MNLNTRAYFRPGDVENEKFFIGNELFLLSLYGQEQGVCLPPREGVAKDLLEGAEKIMRLGLAGHLAALYPKSYGVTWKVRMAAQRCMGLNNRTPAFDEEIVGMWGEALETYASGENPEIILLVQCLDGSPTSNPYIHFGGLPYDKYASQHGPNGDFSTFSSPATQLLKAASLFRQTKTEPWQFNPIVVAPGTLVDVIFSQQLAGIPACELFLYAGSSCCPVRSRSLYRKSSFSKEEVENGIFVHDAVPLKDFGQASKLRLIGGRRPYVKTGQNSPFVLSDTSGYIMSLYVDEQGSLTVDWGDDGQPCENWGVVLAIKPLE